MKIYTFGAEDAPVLLLLPGTCCHWKSNFGAVIPLLADSFRVLCVSYDGFDETEQTEFPTMLEETEKIEAYLKTHCGGHIRAAYGCSLGGSFVGLLAARQNIHMDCGILGSSDLDQASPLAARLQTDFLLPLIYPVVRDGKFKAKFLQKRLDKRARESGDYVKAFLKMFGEARPYVTMEFYEYPDGSGYEGRFTKCGICVLMKELGLYDLTPALCRLDYTMSEAGGVTNFVRQYTLASGGPYCDCGYKKKG